MRQLCFIIQLFCPKVCHSEFEMRASWLTSWKIPYLLWRTFLFTCTPAFCALIKTNYLSTWANCNISTSVTDLIPFPVVAITSSVCYILINSLLAPDRFKHPWQLNTKGRLHAFENSSKCHRETTLPYSLHISTASVKVPVVLATTHSFYYLNI